MYEQVRRREGRRLRSEGGRGVLCRAGNRRWSSFVAASSDDPIRQPGSLIRAGQKRGERGEGGVLIEGLGDAVEGSG
jgi:hypothetical protein